MAGDIIDSVVGDIRDSMIDDIMDGMIGDINGNSACSRKGLSEFLS